jgi:serine/threonine-protein kinase RsbT
VSERTGVDIRTRADIERARREARQLALALGFGREAAEQVMLATSELATNLLKYAQDGRIVTSIIQESGRIGIQIDSVDSGPGIGDIPSALRDGYSTGGGLGSGLPGVVRLMDDVTIESSLISTRKWLTTAS